MIFVNRINELRSWFVIVLSSICNQISYSHRSAVLIVKFSSHVHYTRPIIIFNYIDLRYAAIVFPPCFFRSAADFFQSHHIITYNMTCWVFDECRVDMPPPGSDVGARAFHTRRRRYPDRVRTINLTMRAYNI